MKLLGRCLVVENMADNTTKSTTDGWGPPSTWRAKFAKRDYDEHVAAYQLKGDQSVPLKRRRTASEILEDAYKSQGYEFIGATR